MKSYLNDYSGLRRGHIGLDPRMMTEPLKKFYNPGTEADGRASQPSSRHDPGSPSGMDYPEVGPINLNKSDRHGDRPQLRDEFAVPNLGPEWTAKADELAAKSQDGTIDLAAAISSLAKDIAQAEATSYQSALMALMSASPDLFSRYRNANGAGSSGLGQVGAGSRDQQTDRGTRPASGKQAREQKRARKVAKELAASGSVETARRYFAEDPQAYEAYRRAGYAAQVGTRAVDQPAEKAFAEPSNGLTLGSKKLRKMAEKLGRSEELQRAYREGPPRRRGQEVQGQVGGHPRRPALERRVGTVLRMAVKHVMATGTTATLLVALF